MQTRAVRFACVELLAAAGHDLMGALEVEPVPAQEGVPDVVRYWHTTQGLDVLEPGFVEYPVEDAASLPGVVTKFSAVQDGRRYLVKRRGAAGTVILTGTPHGVGFARTPPVLLKDGDEITIEIARIGQLTNPVKDE